MLAKFTVHSKIFEFRYAVNFASIAKISLLSCACPLSATNSVFEVVLGSFEGLGNFSQQAWLLIGAECENPWLFHQAKAIKCQDELKN